MAEPFAEHSEQEEREEWQQKDKNCMIHCFCSLMSSDVEGFGFCLAALVRQKLFNHLFVCE